MQPDVFFILLIAGVLGLYVEFTHPGVALPGVIGAICLVLALFAMHILPVNFAGLLLIVVALGLFVLEAKYTSHGALAVGGIVAMILGALLLIRSPMTGAGVSLGAALGVTATCGSGDDFLDASGVELRTRGWKQTTAERSALSVGEEAEVIAAIKPVAGLLLEPSEMGTVASRVLTREMVRLQGELWRAEAPEAVPVGTRVRVLRIAGLTAYVAPVTHTIRMRLAERVISAQRVADHKDLTGTRSFKQLRVAGCRLAQDRGSSRRFDGHPGEEKIMEFNNVRVSFRIAMVIFLIWFWNSLFCD